jgi:hypothetical protein
MSVWEAPPVDKPASLLATNKPAGPPQVPKIDFNEEGRLVRLARELAMEMRSTDKILAAYGVGSAEWDSLTRNPWFQSVMASEMAQWNAASTTHERVKLKSAVLVEQFLEEANRRLHDADETLSSKVELFKTLARIANLGVGDGESSSGGFRVVINIAGQPVTTRTIAATAIPVPDDVEHVAIQHERDSREKPEKQKSVQLAGTRITIREPEPEKITPQIPLDTSASHKMPPRSTPPRELQASALRFPARRR